MSGLRLLMSIGGMVMALSFVGGINAMPQMDFMKLMHRVVLDQKGDYVMEWTPRLHDILFEVQVATSGWVGLGFSPNGGMRNSDIVLGWVDDNTGEVFLHDRYAYVYGVPSIDESQDVELLGGYQNDTHTVLRFIRPWNTCDSDEDREIPKEDTIRVIWSYGIEDPQDEMRLNKHVERGTKSLYLSEPQFLLPKFGTDVETWDLFSSNVSLPDDLTTLYWCKLFKIPPLPRKTHVIGYMPVLEEDNMQHVHHILLYECHRLDSGSHYEQWINGNGAQCYGPNMPLSWRYCSRVLIAWAVGGEGDIFPEHVGFPLGEEHGGATYFMMETHYDNPNLRRGVVDSSGIRLFHTEKLRKYDGGSITVGHFVTPNMMIPPGQNWMTVGHCSGQCTQNSLSPEGINVFAGLLHTHLLGKAVTIRHIRDNTELPILMQDLSYDFNFQQARQLKEEVVILPGDSIITECQYDSNIRRDPTFGGFDTEDEMCLGFLFYYPRTSEITWCTSSPKRDNLYGALGIQDFYSRKPSSGKKKGNGTMAPHPQKQKIHLAQLLRRVLIREPLAYQNQSLYDVVTSDETWKDKELIKQLQDVITTGDHEDLCLLTTDVREYKQNASIMAYPQFKPLQKSVEVCTTRKQDSSLYTLPEGGGGGGSPEMSKRKPFVCPPELPSCLSYIQYALQLPYWS